MSHTRGHIRLIALLLATIAGSSLVHGAADSAEEQRQKRMAWWREARFGMFIHWGLYAVPAGEWKGKLIPGIGEWIQRRAKIPVADYAKLADQFNPVQFNANEWVAVAKSAGMKYMVITAKHHDGFAMYGSEVSKYNIVDATPYRKDPLKELAAACQKAGFKLGFYYSQAVDWHEPDAGGEANTWDFPDKSKKDFGRYLEQKVKPQLRELLTGYGPVAILWFDAASDSLTPEQSRSIANLVHTLQPNCLVSGRIHNDAGDYYEAGDNQVNIGKVARDWETPVTLNNTWGFKKDDQNWKSSTMLIRQMARVAGRGGNYLLNVGPTAEGVIPHPSVDRLAAVGQWMKMNGESIYGSSAGPFSYELPWGVITSRPRELYLHVFEWPKQELVMYGLKSKVSRAYLLADPARKPLPFKQSSNAAIGHYELSIRTPASAPDVNDSVVVLELGGRAQVISALQQQPDGKVTLPAYLGRMHSESGGQFRLDKRGVMDQWISTDEWLDWEFQVSKPGTFQVAAITSEQKYGGRWEGGHRVAVNVAGNTLRGVIARDVMAEDPTAPYWPYVRSNLGRVTIGRPGAYQLSLKPESIEGPKKYGLTLVSVVLETIQ